jgi:hypothetical protein
MNLSNRAENSFNHAATFFHDFLTFYLFIFAWIAFFGAFSIPGIRIIVNIGILAPIVMTLIKFSIGLGMFFVFRFMAIRFYRGSVFVGFILLLQFIFGFLQAIIKLYIAFLTDDTVSGLLWLIEKSQYRINWMRISLDALFAIGLTFSISFILFTSYGKRLLSYRRLLDETH